MFNIHTSFKIIAFIDCTDIIIITIYSSIGTSRVAIAIIMSTHIKIIAIDRSIDTAGFRAASI
jgi:hypothetical protein